MKVRRNSKGSKVIQTRMRAEVRGNVVRFPAQARDFSLLISMYTGYGLYAASY
jgi:hypothetical protein